MIRRSCTTGFASVSCTIGYLATVLLCAHSHSSSADGLLPDLLVTWIFQVEVELFRSSGQKIGGREKECILFLGGALG